MWSSQRTSPLPGMQQTTPRRLVVSVVRGRDAGATITRDGPILLGTSELCDLRLTDPTVSRRHALLEPSAVGFRVRDQGSRNGTWQGPIQIEAADLPVGCELRVGSTVLRVDAEEADAAAIAAAREPIAGVGRFVGQAAVLQPLYDVVRRAAPTDAAVLLEGESGTGKELLAEAIHELSPRRGGPLVVVDCGAMPENLIEAELFGHEKGAFTGATTARAGAFEAAHGGTVFLDEIGELPLALQTRLLRVLDRLEVRRIGSQRTVRVDVRIVAATNRNLDREVEEGRFRLDLFHRLAVVPIRLPALRDRPDDIELLARHFLGACGGSPELLGDEVLARLRSHTWPGNVRELRNYVERLVVIGDAVPMPESASRGDASDPMRAAATSGMPYRKARAQALAAFTEAYVADMLARHGGSVQRAAEAAGVAQRHFRRLRHAGDDD